MKHNLKVLALQLLTPYLLVGLGWVLSLFSFNPFTDVNITSFIVFSSGIYIYFIYDLIRTYREVKAMEKAVKGFEDILERLRSMDNENLRSMSSMEIAERRYREENYVKDEDEEGDVHPPQPDETF